MKNILLVILGVAVLGFCWMMFSEKSIETEQTTYTVEFDVDYQKCGNNPIVSKGGVDFGSVGDVRAGRVCSKNGYKNISKIESDIDLSPMVQREGFTGDWLNGCVLCG